MKLTSMMKDAGVELLVRLKKAGLNITASSWMYLPESETYRLFIVSPEVGKEGPKKIYSKVKTTLSKMSVDKTYLNLKDISVVSKNM